MEGTDHVMVDGDGVKSRFNDWQPVSTPLRKYLGGPAGDRVSQVRGLGGGTEVLRLHANAQGFVAAVFADSSIGKFVVNQERERSMLDAGYVLRADEIPDDLWAVIEPVLLPSLAGRRVLPWNDHRLPLDGKNPVMTALAFGQLVFS